MANLVTPSPFQWLSDLERRAKQKAKGLPRQEKIQQIWQGVAFRLGEVILVTSLTEVREVLSCPKALARIPGAKTWVKGLANIRGMLLPVIDLQGCLEGTPIVLEGHSRMLLVNHPNIFAGLLVDEVLGIKYFPENLRDLDTPCKEAWLAPFARGTFVYEDRTWIIFDMLTLVESEKFLKVAL
jgi:twitching motility protein PilI